MSRVLVSMSLVGLVALSLSAGCDKGNDLAKLRTDGYGCTKAGAGATFIPRPGEHCFVCADDAALSKCTKNPVTSGCKEDPAACGKSAR
jgi:hypothetical protein